MLNISDRQYFQVLRREKKIKLTDISEAIGVSHSTLSRYETGFREPKKGTVEKYKEFIINYNGEE